MSLIAFGSKYCLTFTVLSLITAHSKRFAVFTCTFMSTDQLIIKKLSNGRKLNFAASEQIMKHALFHQSINHTIALKKRENSPLNKFLSLLGLNSLYKAINHEFFKSVDSFVSYNFWLGPLNGGPGIGCLIRPKINRLQLVILIRVKKWTIQKGTRLTRKFTGPFRKAISR